MDTYEIENLRRSLAMVSEGSKAPLTTRQAEQLLAALTAAEAELRRLRDGLRQLLATDRHAGSGADQPT